MATDFLRELILSGHEVFLLEDEETFGCGSGNGSGSGSGDGLGSGVGYGDSYGDGYGYGWGEGGGDGEGIGVEKKDRYGYQLPG